MSRLSNHHFPEAGDYDTWVDMGPDQEPEPELIGPMAVAIPVLGELVAVLLFIACAFIWCGIGAGRI